MGTNENTETCKDIAFLRYDRLKVLKAQNPNLGQHIYDEFFDAFSNLQHVTFRDDYLANSDWASLNCDMVIERKSKKKEGLEGWEKVRKSCARVSKYEKGSTMYGPTCYKRYRKGIKSRGEDRETVIACPVESVCPRYSFGFGALGSISIVGDPTPGGAGVESLRPTCYSSTFKKNDLPPGQTHADFEWLTTLDQIRSEKITSIACGPHGVNLGFINGIAIKLSPKRDFGNAINGIKFLCSDDPSGTRLDFTKYSASTSVLTFGPRKCDRGKVAVGMFQFTREDIPVYDLYNNKGEKGLLDVSLYCDHLSCPKYFQKVEDQYGNAYCTLNECSCPNGKPKDADCRASGNAAEKVLDSTDATCAEEKLCISGEEKCASCNFGYQFPNLGSNQCVKIAPSTCSYGSRVLSCADAPSSDPYCLVFDTLETTLNECVNRKTSTGQTCLLKNGTEACNACEEGFTLVENNPPGVTDPDFSVKMTHCSNINECLPGEEGYIKCSLLQMTCDNTLGSYSCGLECNTETSYKVNDTSIPGGLEVCECKQGYYRDSPSVVDRVMGIDKNDFCVTCEQPLCSGHGQCVAPLVPFARPVCACDPNYGGAGCEIRLTKTFTCNDLLRFECVPDPALVNDLQLQPELLLGHGWRCETLEPTTSTFAPADVALDISSVSFSRVRLYDGEEREVSTETFCLLAHLHVQQLGLQEARVRLAPDQEFGLSFVQWKGARVETSVRWGSAQDAFEAAEAAGARLAPPPVPVQLVEPDVSWWALEPAGLCPFPFNTDVFRGNNEEYLFAPCAPPSPESEGEGWFFLAQAVPGEPGSTVGCFLLDASARGKNLTLITDAQFRCAGHVKTAAGDPHSSIDCLLRSPVLVPDIPTSTTAEERGLWVKEQCL